MRKYYKSYLNRYKRKRNIKYLAVGIILVIILVGVSTYSDISQLQSIKNQIDSLKSKVSNTQDEERRININTKDKGTAVNYVINCDATGYSTTVVTLENKRTTLEIDISGTGKNCCFTFTMLRCSFPSLVDKTMICYCKEEEEELIRICELFWNPSRGIGGLGWKHITSLEGFKYCDGSLKDEIFEGGYLLHDLSF